MDAAWRKASDDARAGGHGADLEALGPVANPRSGLPTRPQPTPGGYRCRTIKLGLYDRIGLPFVAYPWFRCRVDLTPGGDLTLAKQTGSQRVTGQIYPFEEGRLVFLGAVAWSDSEPSAPAYGANPERDQAGVVERIGPERWRIALPWPHQESNLDLLELERVGN